MGGNAMSRFRETKSRVYSVSIRASEFASQLRPLWLATASGLVLATCAVAYAAEDAKKLAQNTTQPAAAQDDAAPASEGPIEKVVVTAEKKKASVQDVPIAVTALTGDDLSKRQIESIKDLQFNVPSVTFSKGNFSGNNFQIRGIGVSAVAASADSGVSVHTDNIYQVSTAGLAVAEYFDIDRIEVLRGPQSTLYGRNATGGVVNIITNKPDLDEFGANVEGEYGEFNDMKFRAMVNLPIIEDVLGLRAAGMIAKHDGFVKNLFTGNDVDDQDAYAFRVSARWEPSERTTVDLNGSYFHEDDNHTRSPKQMCHRDPTGVAGCLPDKLAFEPLNSNATFGTTLASKQFWTNAFGPFFANLGLFDLTAGPGLGANAVVPQDLNTINTDFDPKFKSQGQSYTLSIEHELTDWLLVTLDAGTSQGKNWSQQSYNQAHGDDISANIASSMATFNGLMTLFGFDPTPYTANYFSSAPSATCAAGGLTCLPLSTTTNNGIVGGNVLGENILYYSDHVSAYDQIHGADDGTSVELRFQSNFDGPINFLVAGYYLTYEQWVQYYVNANTLDYSSIFLGAFVGNFVVGSNGLMSAPPFYLNDTRRYELDSSAAFGELYWDIVPETLKLTLGLRQTTDKKHTIGQQTILSTYVPIGTPDNDPFLDADPAFDANPSPSAPGTQLVADQEATFDATTGRAVLTWTPTKNNMAYASYSRGFKSGGINPPLSAALSAVPQEFAPETIDAFEIGSKNTLFDGTLRANFTAWHYTYEDYQVSKIVNRTSVNENIGAKLWGLEGELLYVPNERWQFNLSATDTHSEIGESFSIDQRNPTNGVAGTTWVKDIGSGANCVMVKRPGSVIAAATPADAAKAGFYIPPGGSAAIAAYGIPGANFGRCDQPGLYDPATGTDPDFMYTPDSGGIPVSLAGNELPQLPGNTITVGAQYTHALASGLDLTFRVDYYWQTEMWTRIFNRDPIDKIDAWGVMNAHILLMSDDGWHAKVFATNLLDDREITNSYLTDASSGLFTNVFVTDPRIIGLTVGAEF
jgi:iron complex outermembrane recepter protein